MLVDQFASDAVKKMRRLARGLVAVFYLIGATHAYGETCSTLWSKLAHLVCRPQDQVLRDQLDTLTLADGGVVPLRCTENHDVCFRADRATVAPHAPESFLSPEPSAGIASSAMTAVAAARARAADAMRFPPSLPITPLAPAASSAAPSMTAVGGPLTAPARRRLHSSPTLAPTATAGPTPLPAPAPTQLPTPAPSASPVPTTIAITTFNQLRASVARGDREIALPTGVIEFGTEIEVGYGKDIVVLGNGAAATTLSGGGHTRFFAVLDGGNLTLADMTMENSTIGATAPCAVFGRGAGSANCRGGALWVYNARLTLLRCVVRRSVAYVSRMACATARARAPVASARARARRASRARRARRGLTTA